MLKPAEGMELQDGPLQQYSRRQQKATIINPKAAILRNILQDPHMPEHANPEPKNAMPAKTGPNRPAPCQPSLVTDQPTHQLAHRAERQKKEEKKRDKNDSLLVGQGITRRGEHLRVVCRGEMIVRCSRRGFGLLRIMGGAEMQGLV